MVRMNKPYWTTTRRPKPQMKAEYGMSIEIGPSNWRRARLILDGKDGETAEQLLDRTADTVEGWFNRRHSDGPTAEQSNAMNPYPITPVIAAEKPLPEDQRIASLIADIYSCQELKVLESYKLIVKTNQSLQEAYDQMLKKLSTNED